MKTNDLPTHSPTCSLYKHVTAFSLCLFNVCLWQNLLQHWKVKCVKCGKAQFYPDRPIRTNNQHNKTSYSSQTRFYFVSVPNYLYTWKRPAQHPYGCKVMILNEEKKRISGSKREGSQYLRQPWNVKWKWKWVKLSRSMIGGLRVICSRFGRHQQMLLSFWLWRQIRKRFCVSFWRTVTNLLYLLTKNVPFFKGVLHFKRNNTSRQN